MAAFELDHPLGHDVEQVHNALLAGMGDMLAGTDHKPAYREHIKAEFFDPFDTGFSQLRLANKILDRLVWLEVPVLVPESDTNWTVDWGTGLERVYGRLIVRDMLFKGFKVPMGEEVSTSEILVFDVTEAGVALRLKQGEQREVIYGAWDNTMYSHIETMARTESGLDELVVLSDAV